MAVAQVQGNAERFAAAAGPTADANDDDDDKLCAICMGNPREVRNWPCGHASLCEDCTGRYFVDNSSHPKCTLCKQAVKIIEVSKAPATDSGGPAPLQRMKTFISPEERAALAQQVDSAPAADVSDHPPTVPPPAPAADAPAGPPAAPLFDPRDLMLILKQVHPDHCASIKGSGVVNAFIHDVGNRILDSPMLLRSSVLDPRHLDHDEHMEHMERMRNRRGTHRWSGNLFENKKRLRVADGLVLYTDMDEDGEYDRPTVYRRADRDAVSAISPEFAAAVAAFEALGADEQAAAFDDFKQAYENEKDCAFHPDAVDQRDVATAMRAVLTGELSQHATEELRKAVGCWANDYSRTNDYGDMFSRPIGEDGELDEDRERDEDGMIKGRPDEVTDVIDPGPGVADDDLGDATHLRDVAPKAGLKLPVRPVLLWMRKRLGGRRVALTAAVGMAAILEYLCAELWELGGSAAIDRMETAFEREAELTARQVDAQFEDGFIYQREWNPYGLLTGEFESYEQYYDEQNQNSVAVLVHDVRHAWENDEDISSVWENFEDMVALAEATGSAVVATALPDAAGSGADAKACGACDRRLSPLRGPARGCDMCKRCDFAADAAAWRSFEPEHSAYRCLPCKYRCCGACVVDLMASAAGVGVGVGVGVGGVGGVGGSGTGARAVGVSQFVATQRKRIEEEEKRRLMEERAAAKVALEAAAAADPLDATALAVAIARAEEAGLSRSSVDGHEAYVSAQRALRAHTLQLGPTFARLGLGSEALTRALKWCSRNGVSERAELAQAGKRLALVLHLTLPPWKAEALAAALARDAMAIAVEQMLEAAGATTDESRRALVDGFDGADGRAVALLIDAAGLSVRDAAAAVVWARRNGGDDCTLDELRSHAHALADALSLAAVERTRLVGALCPAAAADAAAPLEAQVAELRRIVAEQSELLAGHRLLLTRLQAHPP